MQNQKNEWEPIQVSINEQIVSSTGRPELVTTITGKIKKGQWVTWIYPNGPPSFKPGITKGRVIEDEKFIQGSGMPGSGIYESPNSQTRVKFPTEILFCDRSMISPSKPPTREEILELMIDKARLEWWGI